MPKYSIKTTLTWEIDVTDVDPHDEVEEILDMLFEGIPLDEEFAKLEIKTDITPIVLEDPNTVIRLKEFTPKQVFAWLDKGEMTKQIKIGNQTYEVRLNSARYRLFRKEIVCAACGLKGRKFVLETRAGKTTAHLNLYGEEDGKDVMMTKDHVVAKAYGGKDSMENYRTLCFICNQVKASFPISYDGVKVLRDILRNKEGLPSHELKRKLKETRLLMLDCLNGQ